MNEAVFKSNHNTIERLFEASMIKTNGEISFTKFVNEYSNDICPDVGIISYEDDEVKFSEHLPKDEAPHE